MIRTKLIIALILTALFFGCSNTVEVEEGGAYETLYGGEIGAVMATSDALLRDAHASMLDFLAWCERNPSEVAGSQTIQAMKEEVEEEVNPPSEQGEMIHTYLALRRAYNLSRDPSDRQELFNQSAILSDFIFEIGQITQGE